MKNFVPVFLYFLSLAAFGQTDKENNKTIFEKTEELTAQNMNRIISPKT